VIILIILIYVVNICLNILKLIINFKGLTSVCYLINNYMKLYEIVSNLGIGDWGLGIGPNPQSPIPNPHQFLLIHKQ